MKTYAIVVIQKLGDHPWLRQWLEPQPLVTFAYVGVRHLSPPPS
ncbi:MAG: hypothetical protein NZ703_13595 [Gemmataceae bacterium]|nr:hypothetical protein [Gemmataceae bacterium]MCS7272109.1 hypothetical protein [Gemmataceae bacterium]MDW8243014.1 hypothetical protein [Thermogemmata sp.]